MYPIDLRTQISQILQEPKWFNVIRQKQYRQLKEDVINITSSFPHSDVAFSERLFLVHNNLITRPLCPTCNINYCNWNKDTYSYRHHCSNPLCKQRDTKVKQKREHSMLERYGVTNPGCSDEFNEKRSNTMLERYGVDHPAKSKEIVERKKQTNLKRYGTEYTCQNEQVREKQRITNQERYGVDIPLLSKDIQEKAHQTVIERYGVTSTALIPEIKTKKQLTNLERYGNVCALANDNVRDKIKLTNLERYGVEYVLSEKTVRDKIKLTNLERYGVAYPSMCPSIIQKVKDTYHEKIEHLDTLSRVVSYNQTKLLLINEGGGYCYVVIPYMDNLDELSYNIDQIQILFPDHTILTQFDLEIMHSDCKMTFVEIAKDLSVSPCTVGNWMANCNIIAQSFNISSPHKQLIKHIELYVTDILINNRQYIKPLELDIVLPQFNIAIEVNGLYRHCELQGKVRSYHNNKTLKCADNDITLIHITDVQWYNKQELVKSRLLSKLNIFSNKFYARKLLVKLVSTSDERVFLNKTHLQGYCSSKLCIGLYDNDTLISVMSFGTPRYNKKYQWELLRYSIELNTSIVGGAAKLFKYFIIKYTPTNIISYSDRTWNTGGVYERLDFKYSHSSAPNYWYVHSSNYQQLFHRSNFQKHKLQHKLEIFDSKLSEWENMVNNGYDRYWDCGNDVWVWNS